MCETIRSPDRGSQLDKAIVISMQSRSRFESGYDAVDGSSRRHLGAGGRSRPQHQLLPPGFSDVAFIQFAAARIWIGSLEPTAYCIRVFFPPSGTCIDTFEATFSSRGVAENTWTFIVKILRCNWTDMVRLLSSTRAAKRRFDVGPNCEQDSDPAICASRQMLIGRKSNV